MELPRICLSIYIYTHAHNILGTAIQLRGCMVLVLGMGLLGYPAALRVGVLGVPTLD